MLKRLTQTRLSLRLPLLIVTMITGSLVTMGLLAIFQTRAVFIDNVEEATRDLAEAGAGDIDRYLSRVEAHLATLGASPATASAIERFSASFQQTQGDPRAYLQDVYVTRNPHPVGAKDALIRAEDGSLYSAVHGDVHGYYREIHKRFGYYDLFLFSTSGDLVYSVFKEPDFAENFRDGPYAGTGLGEVFRTAVDAPAGSVAYADVARYAPSANAPAAFLATPVTDPTGRRVGVIAVQLPITEMAEVLSEGSLIGAMGDLYLVGPDQLARTPSRHQGRFQALDPVATVAQWGSVGGEGTSFRDDAVGTSGAAAMIATSPVNRAGLGWTVVAELDAAEVMQPLRAIQLEMAAFVAAGVVAAVVVSLLLARSITAPLGRVTLAMQAVAGKEYHRDIPDRDRHDEIGTLARTLGEFRDQLQASDLAAAEREGARVEQAKVVERLGTGLKALADGNLTRMIDAAFTDDYEQLRQDFNTTITTLNDLMRSIVGNAEEIRSRAEEISGSSDDLSKRTENQAATLEETAAALDELTASVRSAADGAAEVEKVVIEARAEAEQSGQVVREAVAAMSGIKRSSDEISQIIGVIDDIAFQTNLLALNAGVEAARAGDAGRGFAVVASEVRALAQRSSEAAKQIKTLIGGSAEHVETGVALVGRAGEALTSIVARVGNIAGLIGTIASGAREQAVGLSEINVGMTQLDQVTQQNAAMVEEATAASLMLKQEAALLAQVVARFRLGDDGAPASGDSVVSFRERGASPRPAEAAPKVARAGRRAAASHEGVWQDF